MSTQTQPRQPAGAPTGGQFAGIDRPESDVDLSTPAPESAFAKRYDTLEEKLEAFHAELASATAALEDDESWQRYLDTMTKFHRYSFQNQLLIAIQKPDATRVAGYRTWQSVGRQVVKGERSIQILAPKTIRVTEEDANGNPRTGEDGKPLKTTKVVGFTTASVFDVSQTEGEELPSGYDSLSTEPPAGFRADLEAAIAERGFTVTYEVPGDGSHGYTRPSTKSVVVDPTLSDADQVSCLAHELGHIAAGHLERTDEYHTGTGGHRGAMEVEAESISYVLCRANGMDVAGGGHHDKYLAGWTRAQADPDVVKNSAQAVSRCVKGLLGSRTWANALTESTSEGGRR